MSRVIVAADSPASEPRNCSNAGAKSELDRPCRYSSGNTSATRGDFRDHAGKPDVDLMDHTLISNWNAVVTPHDRVIHVGDFAFKCDPKRLRAIFSKLHGQKFLVVGNHDDNKTIALPWAAAPTPWRP